METTLLRLGCLFSTLLSLALCLQYDEDLHAILSKSLHHYSTLHPDSITHTIHGSLSHAHHLRLVQFHTLERNFQLYLKPHYRLFSPGFKVHSLDGEGNRQIHQLNRTEYYHGYMGGEEGSIVTAHISENDGIITASITTAMETYHLEPSYDIIRKPHPPHHMIAYRASDVKRSRIDGSKFDYVVAPPLPPGEPNGLHSNDNITTDHHYSHHQTVKRQSSFGRLRGSSCPMVLVADYRFFNEFSSNNINESMSGITRRLITLVSMVDSRIYRDTVWVLDPIDQTTVTDLGLEIAEVIVHTEAYNTGLEEIDQYYNSRHCCSLLVAQDDLDADGLLSAFNFGRWEDYCLAHLFTFVNFPSNLLGLANIASSFQSQTGGICSKSFIDSSQREPIIYNTGLSSFTSGGLPLIRDEQILVVGHEVGHNWGSHHDPNNNNCKKDYLMNEFAQDGKEDNHFRFSNCSITSIGQVLHAKGDCFEDPDDCGDYVMGTSPDGVAEECDEGPTGGDCCNDECKLKTGAVCSDTNYPCCSDCQVVTMETTVCDSAGSFTTDCRTDIMCNGIDPSCPEINTTGMAAQNSSCLLGRCKQHIDSTLTKCVDFCTVEGKEKCSCSELVNECRLCCKEMDGTCALLETENVALATGTPCSGGSCIGGECVAVQDTISRIFDIITNLDGDEFVLFIEENIVGFTIIFTLILWVPASIFCCCYDRREWWKFKIENVDFIRAIKQDPKPEKQPLIDYGELYTSPVDDSPHPTYSRSSRHGLGTVPEEDEDDLELEDMESESDTAPPAYTTTLV